MIHAAALTELHGEVSRVVVLYRGDDGLDKLEENQKIPGEDVEENMSMSSETSITSKAERIHMHAQLSTSFRHRLDDLLHHLSMSGTQQRHENAKVLMHKCGMCIYLVQIYESLRGIIFCRTNTSLSLLIVFYCLYIY